MRVLLVGCERGGNRLTFPVAEIAQQQVIGIIPPSRSAEQEAADLSRREVMIKGVELVEQRHQCDWRRFAGSGGGIQVCFGE